ncbi:MAG TPA: hypothetical protein PLU71_02875 [Candidatus Dependentiae bacterium]|nr:hypothetical protein [Candidatus Dependentiae bacterium]HRQ62774.1 hypothetical protein [Candidatus Dependentiae bacterium]
MKQLIFCTLLVISMPVWCMEKKEKRTNKTVTILLPSNKKKAIELLAVLSIIANTTLPSGLQEEYRKCLEAGKK